MGIQHGALFGGVVHDQLALFSPMKGFIGSTLSVLACADLFSVIRCIRASLSLPHMRVESEHIRVNFYTYGCIQNCAYIVS